MSFEPPARLLKSATMNNSSTANGSNFLRNPNSGRLVGWLVSYGLDKQGAAFELRVGRTIIGRQPLANSATAVIEEPDISSPHLAVRTSTRHEVFVQDIFSDGGSYVVRDGSKREEKLEGPVQLQHGDWIRLGDGVRFQLCLIDGPR